MRRRLTVTIVGLVAGALLLAGGGALLVGSVTVRHHAVVQLLDQDEALARNASAVRSAATLHVIRHVLRLERAAIVVLDRSGRVVAAAPPDTGALRLPALPATGAPHSGLLGDTAYALVPVGLDPSLTGPLPRGDVTAVLLTRRIGALFPEWGLFVLGALATIVVAAAVAVALGRRIASPLVAASEVTGRIAAGDLDARVPLTGRRGDELDSLGTSINAMAASLQQGRRRETELLASVSHDLRTPLTSIRGYAEAITDGVTGDPRRAAAIITDQATRLERLVGDLLDLAKARARQLRLHPSAVGLTASIDRAIDAVSPEARARGVSLARRSPGEGLSAHADPDRLAQVLLNLLQNAVVHAAAAVEVHLGASRPGEERQVWVSVADDGPGIPAAELERVFDRFYQVDRGPAARVRGSGLGLSIVAELVNAMGGTVRVESPISSDPDRPGTRFVFMLPAAPAVTEGSSRPFGTGPPGEIEEPLPPSHATGEDDADAGPMSWRSRTDG